MFEHFKTKAEIVSAEVHRFPTGAEALDWIVGFLVEEGVADEPKKYAVWARCPFLDTIDRQQLEAIPGVVWRSFGPTQSWPQSVATAKASASSTSVRSCGCNRSVEISV